jgi:hypothetical protein
LFLWNANRNSLSLSAVQRAKCQNRSDGAFISACISLAELSHVSAPTARDAGKCLSGCLEEVDFRCSRKRQSLGVGDAGGGNQCAPR